MVTIYALVFPDKSTYVGATKDYARRCHLHAYWAQRGRSHNDLIQVQFDFWQTFEFKVLEVCKDLDGVSCEQKWISSIPAPLSLNKRDASERPRGDSLTPDEWDHVQKHHVPSQVMMGKKYSVSRVRKTKPVFNATTGKLYPSARVAAEELGLDAQMIRQCANGGVKTYKGDVWQRPGDPPRDLTHKAYVRKKLLLSDAARARKAEIARIVHSSPVKNLDTGDVFQSQSAAAVHFGVSRESIRAAVNGQRKTSAGFRWQRLGPKQTGHYVKSDRYHKGYPNSRAVQNCDTGEIFVSIREAARVAGVTRSSLSNVVNGRAHTCAGSSWVFVKTKR